MDSVDMVRNSFVRHWAEILEDNLCLLLGFWRGQVWGKAFREQLF